MDPMLFDTHLVEGSAWIPCFSTLTWWKDLHGSHAFRHSWHSPGGRICMDPMLFDTHLVEGSAWIPCFSTLVALTWWKDLHGSHAFRHPWHSPGGRICMDPHAFRHPWHSPGGRICMDPMLFDTRVTHLVEGSAWIPCFSTPASLTWWKDLHGSHAFRHPRHGHPVRLGRHADGLVCVVGTGHRRR